MNYEFISSLVKNWEHHIYCFLFLAKFRPGFLLRKIPQFGSIFNGLACKFHTIGLNIQYHIVIGPHGLLPTCTWGRCTNLAPIFPIHLLIGNQILRTNVVRFRCFIFLTNVPVCIGEGLHYRKQCPSYKMYTIVIKSKDKLKMHKNDDLYLKISIHNINGFP